MNDIADLVIAACVAATTGAEFDDPATETGKKSVTVYDSFPTNNIPGQTPTKKQPFILARPVGSDDTKEKGQIFVPLQCGIHTNGTILDGVRDIRRIVGLLMIGFANNEQFVPYSLDRVIVTLGDHQTGDQPHPKYYANIELTFQRASILNNF